MLRTLAERLSRNLSFRRRLPARFGGANILVSPEGGLRYWRLDLEKVDPTLLHAAAEWVRPGNVIWDVGANVGLFTFAAAGLAGPAGQVLAIEPDAWLASLLRRSAKLPAAARAQVDVVEAAVSNRIGMSEFVVASRARSSNHLAGFGLSQAGACREKHQVPTVTLDALLGFNPAPNLVKIDVEGAEHDLLAGAGRLLTTVRPILLCEVSGHSTAAVTKILWSAGYTIFDADAARTERRPLPEAVWNTLALPHFAT
ncbi:MAG TPA: FkbM family methyltransferase [Bryobacteraceae bacterium]